MSKARSITGTNGFGIVGYGQEEIKVGTIVGTIGHTHRAGIIVTIADDFYEDVSDNEWWRERGVLQRVRYGAACEVLWDGDDWPAKTRTSRLFSIEKMVKCFEADINHLQNLRSAALKNHERYLKKEQGKLTER